MIDVINSIIRSVGGTVGTVIKLLPGSPFNAINEYFNSSLSGVPEWLMMLNWVIPMAEIVALLEMWGIGVGLWYAVSVALRWLRAVQ